MHNSIEILFFATIFALTLTKATVSGDDYCYASDKEHPQNSHFTSFTAYEYVRGSELQKYNTVPYCQPTKAWLLIRHGTRMPRHRDLTRFNHLVALGKRVVKNYERIESQGKFGELCKEDLNLIRHWSGYENINSTNMDTLTDSGYKEVQELAERLVKAFPSVIQRREEIYDFRYTGTPRCIDSMKAFIDGVFGTVDITKFQQRPDDKFTRAYEFCPFWKNNFAKQIQHRNPFGEKWKFMETEKFQEMLVNVSRRLGFEEVLELEQVLAMDEMCRYETSWYRGVPSAWCAAFTFEEIELLEYMVDISYYYASGYGFPLNRVTMGSAVLDMIDHLDSNGTVNVVASFAHSNTMKTFITAMGIAQDSMTLRADNYEHQKNRKWKTSLLTPFGGNIVAIRYKCHRPMKQDKVRFFINEERLDMDWCPEGLCDLADVKDKYDFFRGDTLYSSVCSSASSLTSASSVVLLLAFVLIIFHRK